MSSCVHTSGEIPASPLAGKIICLDPGHGGTAKTDHYRVGPSGEREEWINLRVAILLKDMLESKGACVIMTRTEDVSVPLKQRALIAVKNRADVFISIHHNATADPTVNFPIVYFHGNASENLASVQLGKCVAQRIRDALFDKYTPVSLVSDYVIFPGGGTAVLRHSYGIPSVIGEASFFTNPDEEAKLKSPEYNRKEASAYLQALEDFFSMPHLPIKPKFSHGQVQPFEVLQEAARMGKTARMWRQDFIEAKQHFEKGDLGSLQRAYDLFTRSARSFPDSPVARDCHLYRAEILKKMRRGSEAEIELLRAKEYYVPVWQNR